MPIASGYEKMAEVQTEVQAMPMMLLICFTYRWLRAPFAAGR